MCELNIDSFFDIKSFEDLNYKIGYLLKKNFEIHQTHFIYQSPLFDTHILSSIKKKTELKICSKDFFKLIFLQKKKYTGHNVFNPDSQRKINSVILASLTQELKRPVGRVILIPFNNWHSIFLIESSKDFNKELEVLNFFKETEGILDLIVQKNIDFLQMRFSTFLWSQAFQKSYHSMRLLDRGQKEIRCNGVFEKEVPEHDLDKYHKNSYKVDIQGEMFFLESYFDKTRLSRLKEELFHKKKIEVIGELASDLSNQLTNPLAGVRSLSQILRKKLTTSPSIVDDLEEIEAATWRCCQIIENLQNFSTNKVEKTVFDLNTSIKNACTLLKTALHRIEYHIELSSTPLQVLGQVDLMQQVVFNLVLNACQSMPRGGQLWVRSFIKNNKVVLEVRDTGDGVDVKAEKHIFTPFFSTKKESGTGLGLSMSLNIVQKFGGDICLIPVTGKGACFQVMLPKVSEGYESIDY